MRADKLKIVLVTPSLRPGGAERVIVQLANTFSRLSHTRVFLISLTKGVNFFDVSRNVTQILPDFDHRRYGGLIGGVRIFFYLRRMLKELRPNAVLSFGGRYNSFVLLAAKGLHLRCVISDRSRPTISYGWFLDTINRVVYPHASGIVAQTSIAQRVYQNKFKNVDVRTISNPVRLVKRDDRVSRENIILNVGRFIRSKNQRLLIRFFSEVAFGDWRLMFLGDGQFLDDAREYANELGVADRVEFLGTVKDVERYYASAKIFAFTSLSEGFPNALAEALATPLACISFDCAAGPSDLIEDGVNGFLVPEMDEIRYKRCLRLLMESEDLRRQFELMSTKMIARFEENEIAAEYLKFLIGRK